MMIVMVWIENEEKRKKSFLNECRNEMRIGIKIIVFNIHDDSDNSDERDEQVRYKEGENESLKWKLLYGNY